ncbi:MAG: riboflavin synthase [Phycisphaeraceae bacterium]
MFTGLVEEIGAVRAVRGGGAYQTIQIAAASVLEDTREGDSISIDGACQSVTRIGSGAFEVETLAVSLEKTTLGRYRPGRRVNLERSLTPETRMGGHIVQGHVDGVGTVAAVREDGKNVYFSVVVPADLSRYCISEGSIAIDGASLTIADLTDNGSSGSTITVNVIPATWRGTVLSDRVAGDAVNLEVDVLARYVERLLSSTPGSAGTGLTTAGLTEERLRGLGY